MKATCEYELLRLSLADGLTEPQEEWLARHLAECADCQHELARLAGPEKEWSKVSAALKQEAQSGAGCAQVAAPSSEPATDDLAADFAVDFLEPAQSAEAIGRLGDIDILDVLGHGGMGVVLKGYQPELKRLVAVKVLAPHLAVSGPARKRFAREAQAAAAILHPNVMPIFTVHSGGKLPYLVMPLLACESLEQRIAREGPLPVVDILRIAMQTAQGLAAAHGQGIVHRDVKPANILLEQGVDRVMLTDFGLARAIDDASITRTGLIAGTPQFMSPEQARGEALDPRSDLFSLGSALYAMATGRPPFRAETSYGILRRITDADPRPLREINPEIPDWLARIIVKLLAKAPAERYQSAEGVARLLEQCLAHVQQPALVRLPASVRHDRSLFGRRTWLALAGGLAVAAIAALLLWPRGFGGQPDKAGAPASAVANADSSPGNSTATGPAPSDDLPRDSDDQPPPKAAGSAANTDPATDWNAAAEQLERLEREGESFEARSQRPWDRLLPPRENRTSAETPDGTDPRGNGGTER